MRGIFLAAISVAGLCHENYSKSPDPLHFNAVCSPYFCLEFRSRLGQKQKGRRIVGCMEIFISKNVPKGRYKKCVDS